MSSVDQHSEDRNIFTDHFTTLPPVFANSLSLDPFDHSISNVFPSPFSMMSNSNNLALCQQQIQQQHATEKEQNLGSKPNKNGERIIPIQVIKSRSTSTSFNQEQDNTAFASQPTSNEIHILPILQPHVKNQSSSSSQTIMPLLPTDFPPVSSLPSQQIYSTPHYRSDPPPPPRSSPPHPIIPPSQQNCRGPPRSPPHHRSDSSNNLKSPPPPPPPPPANPPSNQNSLGPRAMAKTPPSNSARYQAPTPPPTPTARHQAPTPPPTPTMLQQQIATMQKKKEEQRDEGVKENSPYRGRQSFSPSSQLSFSATGPIDIVSRKNDGDYQKKARNAVFGELSGVGSMRASQISGRKGTSQSPSMKLLGMLHIHDDPDEPITESCATSNEYNGNQGRFMPPKRGQGFGSQSSSIADQDQL